jgi:hypothetical protein
VIERSETLDRPPPKQDSNPPEKHSFSELPSGERMIFLALGVLAGQKQLILLLYKRKEVVILWGH